MTTGVETVLFDLDGTLCEYRRTGEELLDLAFERTGVEPLFTAEEYYDRFEEFVDDAESIDEIRSDCFAALASDRGRDPDVGRGVAKVYSDERDHGNVRFVPDARETIESLSSVCSLGLVTNGGPWMQRKKLDALGLTDSFETIVYAGYDTAAKPDPEPFRHALSELDGTPERAIHVGNSLDADVAGATAAGLTSVWLADGSGQSSPDPAPDHVLESLDGLLELSGLSGLTRSR